MLMKTNHAVHITVFGMVTWDGDIILPLIFPHSLRHNTKTYIKSLKKIVLPCVKRITAERPYIWQQNSVSCYTNREMNVSWENIPVSLSSLTSGHPTPQIAIPLIVTCGGQLSKRPAKLRWTEGKNNDIFYQFKQGKYKKGLQENLNLSSGHG